MSVVLDTPMDLADCIVKAGAAENLGRSGDVKMGVKDVRKTSKRDRSRMRTYLADKIVLWSRGADVSEDGRTSGNGGQCFSEHAKTGFPYLGGKEDL